MLNQTFTPIQKIIFSLTILFLIGLSPRLLAQEQIKPEELFKMSLEELMDIEVVTTVTKYEQTIEQAPAIVMVITDEQIKNRGYRSIVELLKDVLGIDIIDNVARVEMGMRGINNKSDYGKHILFLLDGHDMGWKQFKRLYLKSKVLRYLPKHFLRLPSYFIPEYPLPIFRSPDKMIRAVIYSVTHAFQRHDCFFPSPKRYFCGENNRYYQNMENHSSPPRGWGILVCFS